MQGEQQRPPAWRVEQRLEAAASPGQRSASAELGANTPLGPSPVKARGGQPARAASIDTSALPKNLPGGMVASPNTLDSASSLATVRVGALLKQRDHLSGWRSRHFMLHGRLLSYRVSQADERVRGELLLSRACRVQPLGPGYSKAALKQYAGHFFPFMITYDNEQKSMRLAAPTDGDRAAWLEAIQKAIDSPEGSSTPAAFKGAAVVLNDSAAAMSPKPGSAGMESDEDGASVHSHVSATGGSPSRSPLSPAAAAADAAAQELSGPAEEFDVITARPRLPDGAIGVRVRRDLDLMRAEADDWSGWKHEGDEGGVAKWRGKGGGASGRGDGFVPFSRADILEMLEGIEQKGKTDEQFETGHVVQRYSSNCAVSYFRYKSPAFLIAQRDLCNVTAWCVDPPAEGGALFISASSIEHPDCPPVGGLVRADCAIGGWIVRPRKAMRMLKENTPIPKDMNIDEEGCDCTYLVRTDLKGNLHTSIVASAVAKQAMNVQALRTALLEDYKKQGKNAQAATAASYAKGNQPLHSFVKASPEELQAARASWQRSHTAQAQPQRERKAAAQTSPAITAAQDQGGSSASTSPVQTEPQPAPAQGPQRPAGEYPAEVRRVMQAISAPTKPWKRNSGSIVGRCLSALAAVCLPVVFFVVAAFVLRDSNVVATLSNSAEQTCEWLADATSLVLLRTAGRPVAALRRGDVYLPLLLTVFAVYASAVHMVRAWMGPSWMTNRRKMLIATWDAPTEGNIMGSLDVDVGPLRVWMAEQSKKTGTKVTYTHAVIKATALALRACPGLNGHIACGEFYPSPTVDVGCLVATERTEDDQAIPEEAALSPVSKGGAAKKGRTFDLANATLLEADSKCTAALAVELKRKAGVIRRGKDPAFESTKPLLRALPNCAIRVVLHQIVGFLGNSLGCTLSLFKVKPYMFGSAMVTSVGMMGLDTAWAPFTPWANTPLLVTIGACKDAPVAVNGQVVVRPILTVTAVVDHRYLDGADAANLARVVKTTLEHPELLDFDYDTQA